MQSHTSLLVGPDIRSEGPVSLAQGVYGARGNLELVACDAVAGLWVFWFNADVGTDPLTTPDVPPGHWSGGLSFAPDDRYVDAQILQSTAGPDHLEVLALDIGGTLQSWYWSPGPGFQRRTRDAAEGVSRFAVAHDRGTLRLTVEDAAGITRHLVSPPSDHPVRTWLTSADGPALDVDATDAVVAAGIARDTIVPGTARAAVSIRGGGTDELTWREIGGGIRHLGIART